MKLYNTLTRRKEVFQPIHKRWVGLYTCGPTVYNYAHIGNLRTYIFEDILQRTLEEKGYTVKRVMNITDVGHLTSDADAGEDKIERAAKEEGKSAEDIARFYTNAFLRDIKALNIKKPKYIEPATRHIKKQIALVQQLIDKGHAYQTNSAVYFDIATFPNYTKLSRQLLEAQRIGVRDEVVRDPEKRNPQDFALWFKTVGKFKHHLMHWQSPWGEGFPGWHLECSAISTGILGQPFDIHTGGIDHINIHHTNEIAQSEAAYDKPLANYWLHAAFLIINDDRMGKSKKNFVILKDIQARGFDPLAYRYLTLTAHYRSMLNFSWDNLKAAQNAYENLKLKIQIVLTPGNKKDANEKKFKSLTETFQKDFTAYIRNDLQVPQALAALHTLIDEILSLHISKPFSKKQVKRMSLVLKAADAILGLNLTESPTIPEEVKKLIEEREQSRVHQQFMQADALRKKIRTLGYEIEDTPLGPFIKKVSSTPNT